MDAGLSFIMANHARVKARDLVFDPFVGTGEVPDMRVKASQLACHVLFMIMSIVGPQWNKEDKT